MNNKFKDTVVGTAALLATTTIALTINSHQVKADNKENTKQIKNNSTSSLESTEQRVTKAESNVNAAQLEADSASQNKVLAEQKKDQASDTLNKAKENQTKAENLVKEAQNKVSNKEIGEKQAQKAVDEDKVAIDHAQSQVDEAQKAADLALDSLNEAQSKVTNQEQKVKDAQVKVDNAQKIVDNTNVGKIQTDLDQANKNLTQAKSSLDEENNKLTKTRVAIDNSNEQLKQGQAELTQKQAQLAQANEQLKNSQEMANKANEDLTINENSLNQLKQKIATLKSTEENQDKLIYGTDFINLVKKYKEENRDNWGFWPSYPDLAEVAKKYYEANFQGYKPTQADENTYYTINNGLIDKEAIKQMSLYAASLLNPLRISLGEKPILVSDASIEVELATIKAYNDANQGFGHLENIIQDKIPKEFGFWTEGESIAMTTNSSDLKGTRVSLADLKMGIRQAIAMWVFDDNDQGYGHMTDVLSLRIYKSEDAAISIDKFGIFHFNDIVEPSEDGEFAQLKKTGQTYNEPTDVASELANLEAEEVTKQTSYVAAKANAEQLNNKLNADQQVVTKAQQAVNDKANTIKNIQSSIAQYIEQENNIKNTIEKLQSDIKSKEEIVTNLENQLAETSADNKQKLADLQTVKSNLDEVNNELISLNADLKQKQANNDKAKKTLEEKTSILNEAKQKLELDTADLLSYQQAPENLKKAQDNLAQAQDEVEKANKAYEEAINLLTISANNDELAQNQLAEAKKELASAKVALSTLKALLEPQKIENNSAEFINKQQMPEQVISKIKNKTVMPEKTRVESNKTLPQTGNDSWILTSLGVLLSLWGVMVNFKKRKI